MQGGPPSGTAAGRIPARVHQELADEGLLACAEGLRGSMTYRNYRSKRRYSWWARDWICGAFAVSARRLVVWIGHDPHIDLDLALLHRGAELDVRAERADRLLVAYDAARFQDGSSGRVEIRLHTTDAACLTRVYASAIPDDTPPV